MLFFATPRNYCCIWNYCVAWELEERRKNSKWLFKWILWWFCRESRPIKTIVCVMHNETKYPEIWKIKTWDASPLKLIFFKRIMVAPSSSSSNWHLKRARNFEWDEEKSVSARKYVEQNEFCSLNESTQLLNQFSQHRIIWLCKRKMILSRVFAHIRTFGST